MLVTDKAIGEALQRLKAPADHRHPEPDDTGYFEPSARELSEMYRDRMFTELETWCRNTRDALVKIELNLLLQRAKCNLFVISRQRCV